MLDVFTHLLHQRAFHRLTTRGHSETVCEETVTKTHFIKDTGSLTGQLELTVSCVLFTAFSRFTLKSNAF